MALNIEGKAVRLRAVEPDDAELLYRWENDPDNWLVSGTTEPFSLHQMRRFIAEQQSADLFRTGQLRLMIDRIDAPEIPLPAVPPSAAPGDGRRASARTEVGAGTEVSARTEVGAGTDVGADTEVGAGARTQGIRSGETVGAVDLFEFDPINRRAGIGILIHAAGDRRRGYATDALGLLCRYTRDTLRLHQLWCSVAADNEASLRLFRHAGFIEAGVRRDWQWRPDGYCDEVLFQRILE